MLTKKLSAFLLLLIMSCSAMATEAVAVEDITPAAAEGPLPADQIPPIMNVTKLLGTQPAPMPSATVPIKPPTATPPAPIPTAPMAPPTPTINMPPPQQPPLNAPPAPLTTPSPHAMYEQPIPPGEVMRWE